MVSSPPGSVPQEVIELTSPDGLSKAWIAPHQGAWCQRFLVRTEDGRWVDVLRHVPEEIAQYPAKVRGGLPLLFPVASWVKAGGEMDRYEWGGKTYPMSQHGFARKESFAVIRRGEDELTLGLRANATTLAAYPFEFRFMVTYRVRGRELETTCEVINESVEMLPFSFGFHPYFNTPLSEGSSRNQCRLMVPTGEESFGAPEWRAIRTRQQDAQFLPIGSDFSGTRFFSDLHRPEVVLEDPEARRRVVVGWDNADLVKHVALWAPDQETPYFCIEPWTCLPNSFARAHGVEQLAPGQMTGVTLRIEWQEDVAR